MKKIPGATKYLVGIYWIRVALFDMTSWCDYVALGWLIIQYGDVYLIYKCQFVASDELSSLTMSRVCRV